jgi:hypothetical protein
MNPLALRALFLGLLLGATLQALGWASPLSRAVAASGIAATLMGLLLLFVSLLRRLPRRGLMILALLVAPFALRGLYFLVRFRWLTPGLFVAALLVGVVLLWSIRLRSPTRQSGALLAALCGLGVPLLWSSFPPRPLLQGVKRWRSEPSTRTPLGIAAHIGLLGSLTLLPVLGLVSLRSGSAGTASE